MAPEKARPGGMRLDEPPPRNVERIIHPLFVRITHWINAFATIVMIMDVICFLRSRLGAAASVP
jgi:hypothetical protein